MGICDTLKDVTTLIQKVDNIEADSVAYFYRYAETHLATL